MPRINRFSPTIDAVASNFAKVPEVEAVPAEGYMDSPDAHMVATVASRLAQYALIANGFKHQRKEQGDKTGLAANLFVLCGGLFSKIDRKTKTIGKKPVMSSQPSFDVTCPICDTSTRIPQSASPGGSPQTCPQCGNPVQVQQSEMVQPQLDETGVPAMEDVSENEVTCSIENTLYAFPRPASTSIDDSPYFLWAKRHPLDEIYYRWNYEAQADSEWPDGYSVTYEHALNFWYTGYSSSSNQVEDSCMLLEMFIAPDKVKDFPEGFYLVSANQKDVYSELWDFPEHPITMAYYLSLPTIFFPRSIAFDLIEIQRELNRYESIIALHAMVAAADPVIADANTKVSEITGRSDKVIWWRSIGPNSAAPSRMGAGHLDDGVYKQRDSLHAEFQNISMAVNAFRGQQEGAVVAASAISQLRAQAELMFSRPTANWVSFWVETIRKMVVFFKKYYTFAQLCKIVGPNMENEVRAFQSADLTLTLEWVGGGAGLPKTRDERRQELLLLWDKGVLDPQNPDVRKIIAELLPEAGIMTDFNKDATRARLENVAMRDGIQVQPQPAIEDLATHLYFHKQQAKDLSFDKWTPQAKQLLILHIATTQEMLRQKTINDFALQTTALAHTSAAKHTGLPGGPPPPKPPQGGPGPGPGQSPSQSQLNGSTGAAAAQGQ